MVDKAHPVFAISGNHEYLRNRELKQVVSKHREAGWKISYVDGSDTGSLVSALSPNDFLDDGAILVVVNKPEKAELDFLVSHFNSDDPELVALLYYEGNPKGNTKFGKFLAALKKNHVNFTAPKDWERDSKAVEFCLREVADRGKTMSKALIERVVLVDGSDLGFLSFEIMKFSMIADLDGDTEITAKHVKGTLAPLAEASLVPVVDAVALKNPVLVISAMNRLKANSKKDPTMALTYFLSNAATKWLCITDLRDRGVSVKDAAEALELNPWFYKNKLFPQASMWNRNDVVKLLNVIGDTRRSVLSGQINPWVILSARLLELCR